MGYLIHKTPKSRHSVITIVLEARGDAGELEFFLRYGIEAAKKQHPYLNSEDPEELRKALKEACTNSGP